MALFWWLPFGGTPEIGATELARALESAAPPQLVDVRSRAEFDRGHIRGALSAPITSLATRVESLPLDVARPVVAICFSAHRSIPAVRLLKQRGFEASQLAGGMLAWRAAKLPEESA